jgi:probable F420-dependent oxidoreductase
MRLGVVFPQTEISDDPAVVREYAQATEDLGYTHILAYDHVIGADLTNRPNWTGPYTIDTQFHEVFVLFGYLAGITTNLELVTGVLILPQRQTVLVAKQAIEVDVLSRGRFRLGVGVGWNDVEYEALNENFRNRGRRANEQIEVLRRLFTERSVTFHGRYHHIPEAGLIPRPVQERIPIWVGGSSDASLRRAARLGDGWLPQMPPGERARDMMEALRRYVADEGRDWSEFGIEARISIANKEPDVWQAEYDGWKDLGATHISVNTMGAGFGPREHIEAIRRFKDVIRES